jgi:hypothetical protein
VSTYVHVALNLNVIFLIVNLDIMLTWVQMISTYHGCIHGRSCRDYLAISPDKIMP